MLTFRGSLNDRRVSEEKGGIIKEKCEETVEGKEYSHLDVLMLEVRVCSCLLCEAILTFWALQYQGSTSFLCSKTP